jgi:hypothetical protein
MQVDFSSSGGFANLQLDYKADTTTLPEEQARELNRLVEDSRVFALEQDDIDTDAALGRTDVISYRLTLSEETKQTTLWLNDITAPASMRPLLSYLRKLALEQRKSTE